MNQKLENLLNLALETPENIREQTDNLNVGFDASERSWELIVKYHGSLSALSDMGITVEELIAGYAILTVPEQLTEAVADLEQIEYVEKPKRYYYSDTVGIDSCVPAVTAREPFLTGKGVLIAVLDSGIAYQRPDFRDAEGRSRILALWDQTLMPDTASGDSTAPDALSDTPLPRRPPAGFSMGVEFTREDIDRALLASTPAEAAALIPSIDVSGHGTAVAGIAAGYNPSARPSSYEGVAIQSSLLIVKLGTPDTLGFPRTTEVMRGVAYAVRKGIEWNMPLVINLSFGNTYGPHDGSSLLERFLDNAAEIGRTVICVGSGNEGNSAGHLADNVASRPAASLAIAPYERSLSLQLWKNYSDRYAVTLRSPGGASQVLPDTAQPGKHTIFLENTQILIFLGEPLPYSVNQEIYFDLIPSGQPFLQHGIWQLSFRPLSLVTGQYYLYLPSSGTRNADTGFLTPTPQVTITIPATASKVITVAGYDAFYDSYADFSGRGYVDEGRTVGVVGGGLIKPDLAAPAVNITAPDRFSGYHSVTGTSFATPIVSGSAALLMEWGIVRQNDPFLYGEKVKAYLRSGARPIRGEERYPNDRVGFGSLCVRDSLPL